MHRSFYFDYPVVVRRSSVVEAAVVLVAVVEVAVVPVADKWWSW